ncbi:MltA domain-containing protein [Belnapia sp. T6]|uniref:peptidoglycan lytic exotransglycosylase n=1 Tax=Belnapia mucosa TaxID=2804532 RepID=A0ABS1VA84_9PROT|nr:MltA domain-containing protein [Belnapia mucosa]MBL6458547.1 MltA domain-containing protein [Belnapia mucosa]
MRAGRPRLRPRLPWQSHGRTPFKNRLLAAAFALLLGGAGPFDGIPGWPGEAPEAALPALRRSCEALLAGPAEFAAPWRPACEAVATVPPEGAAAFFESWFTPHPLGTGLVTGYYEPELRGAEWPGGEHAVPLYAPPPEGPLRLLDRAAIEAGGLEGQGLELAWLDDPVDAFFLQIQGSGRVRLPDGRVLRLGYAGRNAHPYRPIGASLIARGAIAREAMSMQAIRAWLGTAPPGEAAALLRENPSYVFFRQVEGLDPEAGPIGTLGVPLTPGRSLAVDAGVVPLGAPVFLATRDPLDGTPLRRLVLAQDTGGAIRGVARGDLFWGWGPEAETRAGLMRETSELYLLLPR